MRPASPRAEPAPAVNGASGHAPGTAAVRPPATVAPMTLGTSVSNSRGVPGLVSGKYVWRSTVPNPGEAEGGGGGAAAGGCGAGGDAAAGGGGAGGGAAAGGCAGDGCDSGKPANCCPRDAA